MKTVYNFVILLFFNQLNVYCHNSKALDHLDIPNNENIEESHPLLTKIDSIVWHQGSMKLANKHLQSLKDNCKNEACPETIATGQALIAELEINQGINTTVEEVLKPAIENKSFSDKTLSLFNEIVGFHFLLQGDSKAALSHLNEAKAFLESQSVTSKRLGKVYYYLGFAYNLDGYNKESIDYLRQSDNHFTEIGDTSMLIESKVGLSTLLATDGNYEEATKLLLKSIEMSNSNEQLAVRKFQMYDALIDLYIRSGNYDKAEARFAEVMPELQNLKVPVEQKANDLWSLSMSYAKLMGRLERFQEGLQHVDTAYVYANYLGDYTIRITDLRRAGLLVKSGKYEIAQSHMYNLLQDLKPYGEIDAFHAVMLGLFSNIYADASIKPTRQVQKELLPIVDRIRSKNIGQINSDVLETEKLSTVLGMYQSDLNRSLNSFTKVIEIKDSLQSLDKTNAINESLVKFETKEKESIIQIQELELKQKTLQRNALIGISLASAFGLAFFLLFYLQKRRYSKELEKEVSQRTADLHQSNLELNESKEELERYHFIASHDLKEPLRNVVSFVEYIKKKDLVKDKVALDYFGYIEKGAYQMHKIVQDLADLSRLQDMHIHDGEVNMKNLVEDLKKDFQPIMSSQMASISTRNLPNYIETDETIIYHVFKNLVENGLKFNEKDFPFVNIEYQENKQSHIFEFIDNGIGIEEEYHDKIFELFKRLNNRSHYGGSGVGLAVCKKMIGKINGNISVKGNKYGGSTFVIEIPKEAALRKAV